MEPVEAIVVGSSKMGWGYGYSPATASLYAIFKKKNLLPATCGGGGGEREREREVEREIERERERETERERNVNEWET